MNLQEQVQESIDTYLDTNAKPSPRARDGNKIGAQYAEALDALRAADAKMRRAFHAYERALKTERRLGKILDKLMVQS
jgi:hypothetical protein